MEGIVICQGGFFVLDGEITPKRTVIRGKLAGMCNGVRDAISQTDDLVSDKVPTYYQHSLVHNDPIMQRLHAAGLKSVDASERIDGPKYFVGSAHGLGPCTRQKYEAMGFTVYSTTCPIVASFQRKAADQLRRGFLVVVLGKKTHREIEAVVEYLEQAKEAIPGSPGYVVASSNEIANIGHRSEKIALVGQTTIARSKFAAAATVLRELGNEVKVVSTLCPSVEDRVKEAIDIAERVQLMVEVGSIKTSSNTRELYETVSTYCKSICVNTSDELTAERLEGISTVGLTAAASVDIEMIDAVEAKLRSI